MAWTAISGSLLSPRPLSVVFGSWRAFQCCLERHLEWTLTSWGIALPQTQINRWRMGTLYPRTDEGDTRRRNPLQRWAIIAKILVRVDRHLTISQHRHEPRIDLVPSSLQTTNGRRIQSGNNRDHAWKVLELATSLSIQLACEIHKSQTSVNLHPRRW